MSAKEAIVPSTYPNPCRARHVEHCLPEKELWLGMTRLIEVPQQIL